MTETKTEDMKEVVNITKKTEVKIKPKMNKEEKIQDLDQI